MNTFSQKLPELNRKISVKFAKPFDGFPIITGLFQKMGPDNIVQSEISIQSYMFLKDEDMWEYK